MKPIERLKNAIEFIKTEDLNLTNDLISLRLGYRSKTYLSDILGGSKPINNVFLDKLMVEYSINPSWILTGKGEMIEQAGEKKLESKSIRKPKIDDSKNGKRIPFYDAEAVAGITETEMTPIHAPAGTIDVGDLLHDSQAAIRIYGNSMIPNYPPGCVVGLTKATSSFIEPGEVYVIETRDRRLLKRLFYKDDDPDSEYIVCLSDNILKFEGGARDGKLAYPPFNLHKDEIINLFIVTGVIKRNANSVVMNRSV